VHQGSISAVLHLLISLAQGSFFTAEIKHHSAKLKVELICLTSVEHPMVLYNSMSQIERSSITWPEIMRRVRTIVKCSKIKDFFGEFVYNRELIRDDYADIAGNLAIEEEQNAMMREQNMDVGVDLNHDPYDDFEFHD
jgi:hypothetical protein